MSDFYVCAHKEKFCGTCLRALNVQHNELESELSRLKEENERLLWNLAGCSTYALGYGLDESHSEEMALPALNDVKKLALRSKKLEAVAKAAMDAFIYTENGADDISPFARDEAQAVVKKLRDAFEALDAEVKE